MSKITGQLPEVSRRNSGRMPLASVGPSYALVDKTGQSNLQQMRLQRLVSTLLAFERTGVAEVATIAAL